MNIVSFPHPTLKFESKPLKRVDAKLHRVVEQMFELMYDSKGIGLAANQVDLPFRLFVVDPTAEPNSGEAQVFINPMISRPRGSDEADEGCLSLPGLYAPVIRPSKVHVQAYNLSGELFDCDVDGLYGRVIQHETDHLDGVLFIDRLSESNRIEIAGELEEFELDYRSRRQQGEIPSDEAIAAERLHWEKEYC